MMTTSMHPLLRRSCLADPFTVARWWLRAQLSRPSIHHWASAYSPTRRTERCSVSDTTLTYLTMLRTSTYAFVHRHTLTGFGSFRFHALIKQGTNIVNPSNVMINETIDFRAVDVSWPLELEHKIYQVDDPAWGLKNEFWR